MDDGPEPLVNKEIKEGARRQVLVIHVDLRWLLGSSPPVTLGSREGVTTVCVVESTPGPYDGPRDEPTPYSKELTKRPRFSSLDFVPWRRVSHTVPVQTVRSTAVPLVHRRHTLSPLKPHRPDL